MLAARKSDPGIPRPAHEGVNPFSTCDGVDRGSALLARRVSKRGWVGWSTTPRLIMFRDGYLTIGRWRGAPIRLHWTLPLGAFFFGRAQIVPAFWLGFFTLVFVHEMGHAVVVASCRQRVLSIDIHGLGGVCRWSGGGTELQRAAIAWGGVWGQILLLVGCVIALWLWGPVETAFTAQLASAFVQSNLLMMAMNLLPIPPLDGAEAWRLFPLWIQRLRRSREQSKQARERAAIARRLSNLRVVDDDEVELKPEVKAAVDAAMAKIDPKRKDRNLPSST